MRRATGPGKVSDDLLLPFREGITGLLFNFDIDDATVKPEHQEWLEQHAAPILSASPNSRVALKGTASRSGAASYNLQLSGRRVDAVKNFLVSKGTRGTQFDVNFVGEADAALAGKRDGTEDELDRAVAVKIRPPARRGLVRFRRLNPLDIADGFDQNSTPQWLMVPADGFRRILPLINGEGIRLVTGNPTILRLVSPTTNLPVNELIAGSDFEFVRFEGGLPGSTTVRGFEINGNQVLQLDIDVLARKEVEVAFHFVSDSTRSATRPTSDVETFLAGANRVFHRQANIVFKKKSSGSLAFRQDLGDPMTEATAGTDFSTLTARGDRTARINVFFVWEWQRTSGTGDTDARVDAIGGRNVVFEDNAGTDVDLSFAHECGHCLGLEHTGTTDDSLRPRVMWNFTDQRGPLIIRSEITTARNHV